MSKVMLAIVTVRNSRQPTVEVYTEAEVAIALELKRARCHVGPWMLAPETEEVF